MDVLRISWAGISWSDTFNSFLSLTILSTGNIDADSQWSTHCWLLCSSCFPIFFTALPLIQWYIHTSYNLNTNKQGRKLEGKIKFKNIKTCWFRTKEDPVKSRFKIYMIFLFKFTSFDIILSHGFSIKTMCTYGSTFTDLCPRTMYC